MFQTLIKIFNFRPSFEVLDVWLENLAKNLSAGRNPSSNLRFDIEHFIESSSMEKLGLSASITSNENTRLFSSRSPSPLSKKSDLNVTNSVIEAESMPGMDIDSGPSSILMPMVNANTTNGISLSSHTSANSNSKHTSSTFDNNCSHKSSNLNASEKIIDQVPSSNENTPNEYSSPFMREIPKSPHLSKDFSPNGERLRNSLRFRRQERIQKQRSLRSLANLISQKSSCSWDSGNENSISSANTDDFESDRPSNYFNFPKLPLSDTNNIKPIGKKSKPYGEKGFIIHVNDGALTLNDVKDLNNCYSDDFDSSCDTSLNYIDPDSLNVTIESEKSPKIMNKSNHFPMNTLKNASFEVAVLEKHQSTDENKRYLDEVRENLNKCKSKLDALDIDDVKMAKKSSKPKIKSTKVSLNDILPQMKKDHFDTVVTKPPNMSVFTRLHPATSPIVSSQSTHPKATFEQSKRTLTKRSETQNGTATKIPQKNYCKNTLAFIEKINDGISDRHQKSGQSEKRGGHKKNNTTNTQDVLTRKPPAPTSPKKIPATVRNTDKQKKSHSHLSPTRKQRL